jgi:WD40 repeat protein
MRPALLTAILLTAACTTQAAPSAQPAPATSSASVSATPAPVAVSAPSPPAPSVSPVTLPAFTGDASSVSGLRTNALGELRGNWIFVGRWVPRPQNTTIDVQIWAVPLSGGAPKPVFAYEAPSGGIPEAILDNAPYLRRQFSPDGRQFIVSISAQLVIVDLPTGQARRLGVAGYFPSWSKDGSQIAYLAEKPTAGGATPDHVIYAIPSSGGAPRELLNIGASANGAEWSPDGSQLLVGAADGITILDARTGAIVRRLTGTSAAGSSIAQWRASAPQIALLESACGQSGSATTRLVILDGSGAPERVAFDTLATCGTISLSDPRWNPASGNQVLFVAAKIAGGTANFGVRLVDVASNTDTALPLNASEATWTWDGQQIVYLEKTTTATPHGQSLHVASRDGRNDQLVLREDGSFFFSVASLAY